MQTAVSVEVLTKWTGHIVQQIPSLLPLPRHKKDRAFLDLVDQVYAIITGKTQDEATELGSQPGGAPGNMRAVPHANINQIAGLLEQVDSDGGKVDVYKVAPAFGLALDELLPIVEACELLSFATLGGGDIALTPLGKGFAEADIQKRKDILAPQIQRIPVLHWIAQML